ncbi:MAG: pyruvate kinase [Planctomycetota bacterium]|jgi:pyruvate kinase|nr:pyruvate kinase [Planctomycetota bacterium]
MRQTRIVATLGPASVEVETLCQLIAAGVDVFRCNFAYGTLETHQAACEAVREAASRAGKAVALMQDLRGPKIRVGEIAGGKIELREGQELTITAAATVGTAILFSTNYKQLPRDVAPKARIFLDEKNIELEVVSATGADVRCRVAQGGVLHSGAGINLPGIALSTPSITPEDFADLEAGKEIGFDYVAVPFVRSTDDINKVRRITEKFVNPPLLLAKIEKEDALDDIDGIINAADGIIVAGGDLAVELAVERVPVIQQNLIHRANTADKLVLVATQILDSAEAQSALARGKTNDVANAIFQGADAIVITTETAIGRNPEEAVKLVVRVAEAVEHKLAIDGSPHWNWRRTRIYHPIGDVLSNAAYHIAKQLSAAAIVAFTHSGRTAMYLSKCRSFVRLVVFTRSPEVARKMRLFWGVDPVCSPDIGANQDLKAQAEEYLRSNNFCGGADNIVLIGGNPFDVIDHSNRIEVTQLSGSAAIFDRTNQKKSQRINASRGRR